VLAVSEIFVPGGVVFFLGAGAAGVAGLRALGLIDSMSVSLVAWMGLSLGSLIALRGFLTRYTSSEKSFQPTDEDLDAYGELVQIQSEVSDQGEGGRIRFRGTTWAARSVRGALPPGSAARILHRDNLVWVVEAAEPSSIPERNTDKK